MITFKQFLLEEDDVISSKRKTLLHLQNMKPIEFIEWIKGLHDDFGGVLSDLEVTLKVDGLGARFGKDKNDRFFFEGSRTGPIFEPKSFSKHAKEKGSKEEIVARAGHYDDMFDTLQSSKLMKAIPNDTKVVCEVFYNPMGVEQGNNITFVSVKYDKSKLGSLMTIVPISVLVASSGTEHKDAHNILEKLYAASDSKIKVVNPKLETGKIDIRAHTRPILKFGEQEIATLKSLKATDKPAKQALLTAIQKAKEELAEYLLHHPSIKGKEKLGKDIEGLVLKAGNQPVKVTTQEFKDSKRKEREARSE